MKKRFCPISSLYIEHNKGQDAIFDGPQGLFDNHFPIDKIFSMEPKRSIARNFSKINCSHGDKRFGWPFILIIIVKNLREQIITAHNVFDNYCESYKIIFSGLERLLKTQFFEIKCYLYSREKFMAPFLS